MSPWFDFASAALTPTVAHDGVGEVLADRVVGRDHGPLAWLDLVDVPPGVSIGRHTHGDDEELYVIVSGRARMVVDGETREVGPGDAILNRVGGTHELHNEGSETLRMVVVDIRTPSEA